MFSELLASEKYTLTITRINFGKIDQTNSFLKDKGSK